MDCNCKFCAAVAHSPLGVDKMEAMEALVPNHALASTSPSAVSVAVVEPLVGVAEALVRVGFVNL